MPVFSRRIFGKREKSRRVIFYLSDLMYRIYSRTNARRSYIAYAYPRPQKRPRAKDPKNTPKKCPKRTSPDPPNRRPTLTPPPLPSVLTLPSPLRLSTYPSSFPSSPKCRHRMTRMQQRQQRQPPSLPYPLLRTAAV